MTPGSDLIHGGSLSPNQHRHREQPTPWHMQLALLPMGEEMLPGTAHPILAHSSQAHWEL